MSDLGYIFGVAIVMAVVTFGLRALPFVASRWLQSSSLVKRAGKFLPLAIMTLLVIHSVAGAAAGHSNGPWFEITAIALVILIQWFTKHTLFSMLAGTLAYVVLRNWIA
ncbi:MAG: branched-chain amino acid transport [Burkholderiaceae bacterium]|nr:branched-chain amino acid transport [Burkholderiaceae bacterium]